MRRSSDPVRLVDASKLTHAVLGRRASAPTSPSPDSIARVVAKFASAAEATSPRNSSVASNEERRVAVPAEICAHAEQLRAFLSLHEGHVNVDVTEEAERGYKDVTPLMHACAMGSTTCLQLLLSAGGDPNVAVGQRRATALHVLCDQAPHEMDEVTPALMISLISAGAEVEAPDVHGMAPSHWACKRGNVECLRLLLDSGAEADAESRGAGGCTPAHLAAKNGHAGCLSLLLARGADPLRRHTRADEPCSHLSLLSMACHSGSAECVRILLRTHAFDPAEADWRQATWFAETHGGGADSRLARVLAEYAAQAVHSPRVKHGFGSMYARLTRAASSLVGNAPADAGPPGQALPQITPPSSPDASFSQGSSFSFSSQPSRMPIPA
jgi:hypothetical protein